MFYEFFLEDTIGVIPKRVSAPTSEILTTLGDKWQEWLLWQIWVLQRKSVDNPKLSDIYMGMLLELQILLKISVRPNPKPLRSESPAGKSPEEVINEALKGVDAFSQGLKEPKEPKQ